MKRITVLYDARCGFCSRSREWLESQPAFVEVECLRAGSPEAFRRFPGYASATPGELVVIGDDGSVWLGARGWIMCLWALVEYREWSLRLAEPALFPVARRAFELLSASRGWLSSVLGLAPERELEDALELARAEPRLEPTGGRARCGYCHDDTSAGESRSCPRCRSILHDDCAAELGRCATLGCAGAP